MRKITYVQAINEALRQMLESDERVLLIGQGVTSPWYVGNTTTGLIERFGPGRIIDTPVSESGVTGVAVGAALAGMRPILVHPRMDFMYYGMDAIVNQAANWHYMFGGQTSVPVVIWVIVNRGGEQGAQHSQSIQAVFAHIPGLKVVMPSTPYDVKGLLTSSIEDGNPVIFIDDRWLYNDIGEVPEAQYSVPIGEGVVRRKGKDVTVVATSFMAGEAVKAAKLLEKDGVDAEVIDPRTIKPLDENLILDSIRKTGRLVIADAAWKTGGIAGEIAALVSEKAVGSLKAPLKRVCLPDAPAPASAPLEKVYYPKAREIVSAVKEIC